VFISFVRETSRAFGKTLLWLFCTAALLTGAATAGLGQSATPAQAINLSTRMRVQTGDNVGIGGFIITGTGPKRVIIRALGPSLASFGLADVLANPELEVNGPDGFTTIINDEWKDTQQAEIMATGLAPANLHESAIVATLNPGPYTAAIRGVNNSSGVGLVEVYDLNQSVGSKLANISTRAFVSTGNNIVIAGFRMGNNSGGDSVVVRGIGPSLAAMGVANPLANPTLALRNSQGALLVANDDWRDEPVQASELTAAGLAPTNDLESGVVAMLPPGLYTALLAGQNNGVGVGMVEVYDLGTAGTSTGATVTRVQAGNSGGIEKQHVAFDSNQFSGTFRISVYHPATINDSDIGARATLHGQTGPISFSASEADIIAALKAVTEYRAYGQFGNLEFGPGGFSYFATQGAVHRDPIVHFDGPSAAAGFTIEFGSLVGSPPTYNTWVAGMPLVTIAVP
jgi:hypothetical protein